MAGWFDGGDANEGWGPYALL